MGCEFMIYTKVNINNITKEEYEKWYSLMGDEKKLRIDKYRFTDDQKRSIAGEMLAKTTIGKYLDIPAEQIKLAQGKSGKPYAVNFNIEFNISHCEEIVVCAINNTPVGIDIERIRPISPEVAKKFFTIAEQKYILGKTPCAEDYDTEFNDVQLKRFFECWTAKEAYLKYTGEGLTDNLSALEIDNTHITKIIENDYIISIYC